MKLLKKKKKRSTRSRTADTGRVMRWVHIDATVPAEKGNKADWKLAVEPRSQSSATLVPPVTLQVIPNQEPTTLIPIYVPTKYMYIPTYLLCMYVGT